MRKVHQHSWRRSCYPRVVKVSGEQASDLCLYSKPTYGERYSVKEGRRREDMPCDMWALGKTASIHFFVSSG